MEEDHPDPSLPGLTGPQPDAVTSQVLATVLSRQGADSRQLLGYLAERLGAVWPEAVKVRRRGLLRSRPEALTVRLGQVHYDLAMSSGRLTATAGHAVGGVVLRRDELSVGEWASRLVRDLAVAAEQSEEARRALARLTN